MELSLRLNDKSTLLLVKVQQQALSEASIPLDTNCYNFDILL